MTPPLLSSPPRRVPLSLAIVNLCSGMAQVGWLLFGFGMIFVWVFAGHGDYSVVEFRGVRARTLATVESSWPTSFSENKERIWATTYTFSAGGRTFRGTSYATSYAAEPGSQVAVEYIASNPELSRIEGMRRGAFSPFVLFIALLPLAGIVLVAWAWQRGHLENDLLRDGILTTGTVKESAATNTEVNGRPVIRMRFAFTARDGTQHETTTYTTDPAPLSDESREALLYDPLDPDRAFMLDAAPRPRVDSAGELIGRPAAAIGSLILPVVVLAGNALAVALHFI